MKKDTRKQPNCNWLAKYGLFLFFLFFVHSLFAQKDTSGLLLNLQQAKAKLYTNPPQAQLLLEQLYGEATKRADAKLQLESAKQLALLHMNAGRYAQAREYLLTGIAIAEQQNNTAIRADFVYLNATTFHAQGDLSNAVGKYLEALRTFELIGNDIGALNTFTSLADIYSRQNNFSRAIEFNLKALKLFEQKNDKFRQLNIYEQVGSIYTRQSQYKKASDFYSKALAVYRELGNKAGEAATLINLASIENTTGNYLKALALYKQATSISSSLKIVPLEIRSLIGSANTEVTLKNYETANINYRKAIVLAKKSGMKIELEEAYEGLAEVYKGLKDPGTSKAYRSLSSEIKDSLFNDSILRRTTDLQLLYETEKKQAQIELMNKEDKLKELDLSQTKQVKNFFIALSVLLVVLVLVFVYFISQNRKINQQLTIGMAELEVKNKENEKQREMLSQLNQVKDRFFSIISHDLRNNLTTMKLYFDLVSSPEYKESGKSQLGKDVAGSVQNTIDLLENLLVWASGQIKGVEVLPKRINLHKMAELNCQMLMSMAYQKNISLVNETDEDACILADENMVNLILRNLLSNALKFTPDGGSVTILSQEEDDFHQIIVLDNGVGIKADKIKDLFTAHINVSTQGTGNEKGTGLGLMLCKDFIERNGGQIWVESEEGKGSSFYFTFPKCS